MPELSTSSLPDLIFTILFFFMMVTSMREVTLKVKFTVPQGTELEKLEHKQYASYIYIGPPTDQLRGQFGTGSRIQLNDRYSEPREIYSFIGREREREGMDGTKQVVSIKADVNTQMGLITDIKEQLRKAYALRLNYSATKRN